MQWVHFRVCLLGVLVAVPACVIPRETPNSPQGVRDRAEVGLESGLAMPDCDGCNSGAHLRVTGLYRTAPEIPIAIGAGLEHTRFRHTYPDGGQRSVQAVAEVRQLALQLFTRYYALAEPVGAPGGSAEGWIDLGLGLDSLQSDRSESESDCSRNAPLVLLGIGGGYRLTHNTLVGLNAGIDARLDVSGGDGGLQTGRCPSIPDPLRGTAFVTLMTRIAF